jgi:hypothetical protein
MNEPVFSQRPLAFSVLVLDPRQNTVKHDNYTRGSVPIGLEGEHIDTTIWSCHKLTKVNSLIILQCNF